MKDILSEEDLVVMLDFAENYTCQVQNAIQSQHWAKYPSDTTSLCSIF